MAENVVAVIQARIGSSRLPGKIIKDLVGRPLLLRVIERVRKSKSVTMVIVATTINPADDIVESLCKQNNILVFRGSENDVLDRFYQCARKFYADVIVRITADCPLIDPDVIDKVVSNFKTNHADFCSNVLRPSFPDGLDVEVVSFSALQKAWKLASLQSDREHVMPFITSRPGEFALYNVSHTHNLSFHRWTVDYEDDFEFVQQVMQALGPECRMQDILLFLEKNPQFLHTEETHTRNESYIKSLQGGNT